jgi:hypothetical protein
LAYQKWTISFKKRWIWSWGVRAQGGLITHLPYFALHILSYFALHIFPRCAAHLSYLRRTFLKSAAQMGEMSDGKKKKGQREIRRMCSANNKEVGRK